jgi:hypothetical protein
MVKGRFFERVGTIVGKDRKTLTKATAVVTAAKFDPKRRVVPCRIFRNLLAGYPVISYDEMKIQTGFFAFRLSRSIGVNVHIGASRHAAGRRCGAVAHS